MSTSRLLPLGSVRGQLRLLKTGHLNNSSSSISISNNSRVLPSAALLCSWRARPPCAHEENGRKCSSGGNMSGLARLLHTTACSYMVRSEDIGVCTSEDHVPARPTGLPSPVSAPAGAQVAVSISSVQFLEDKRMLQVEWHSGKTSKYPLVWLRDNCQCSNCFHPVSLSRTMLMADLDINICPVRVQVKEDGQQMLVEWSDGHYSQYKASWLEERAFQQQQRQRRAPAYKLDRQFWGSELLHNLPRASFFELLESDRSLFMWLQQLEVFGFVLIGGAPAEPGQVRRLIERIGFIRKTHYGEDFTVKAKDDPSNVAYSSGPLQLHADLPYYEYKPGMQLIHCIVQYAGDGGESQITDAVHVAHELKLQFPEKYNLLRDTPVDWCDIGVDEGGEFYKVLQRPVICEDSKSEISRINFSQPQRDSFFSIPVEDVAPWYDALKTFHDMLYDPKYCLRFKMIPGNIMSFDNLRLVHGRTSYNSGVGERHIEGCYCDWDEIRSRRRVLESKLGLSSHVWVAEGKTKMKDD